MLNVYITLVHGKLNCFTRNIPVNEANIHCDILHICPFKDPIQRKELLEKKIKETNNMCKQYQE